MTTAPRRTIRPVTRALIAKAKPDESWVALYNESGQLIGICDPKNITPIAESSSGAPQQAAPKAAPAKAPVAAAQQPDEMAKQQAVAQLRKGLNAPRAAAENDLLAQQMGAAATRVLSEIHKHPRGR
ncbi:hypothetical protein [Streptacidiphilus sp. PAMC 29251]